MPDSNDPAEVDSPARRWVVGGIYAALIAANIWIAFDWWRDTDQGRSVLERLDARITAAKLKAQECEGCARRKASLKAAVNRMHFQAIQIVEGEDVPTQPEQP